MLRTEYTPSGVEPIVGWNSESVFRHPVNHSPTCCREGGRRYRFSTLQNKQSLT